MDILPRSNFPSYIEGNPAATKPENTPSINPTTHVESKGQSNEAVKPGLLGKNYDNATSATAYLLISTFNKSNGGLGEYCGPNAPLMNGNWQTQPSWPPKKVCSCEPQQANGNQNPASTSSRWLPCNHRPRNDRSSQTDISRFLSNR